MGKKIFFFNLQIFQNKKGGFGKIFTKKKKKKK